MSITCSFQLKIANSYIRDEATLVLELIKEDCSKTPQKEAATTTRKPSMFREMGRMSSRLSMALDNERGWKGPVPAVV